MKIIRLTLVRYKRMQLNGIHSFTITPKKLIQIILGQNGCGKSSLLSELTPLPPDPNHFYKDGSKIIEIQHNNHTYVLTHKFGSKAEHSFIRDGEELNNGKTITVFRELVKQEFNLTAEIHELILKKETFHDMSPSRRREWFTKLSDVSYDYALSIYEKFREKHRDTIGALKRAKKRLVAETQKVVSGDEEQKLSLEIESIHAELKALISLSSPPENTVEFFKQSRDNQLEKLAKLSERLLRIRIAAPYMGYPYGIDKRYPMRDDWGVLQYPAFTSIQEIEEVIDYIRHQITSKETLMNNKINEHSKLESNVKILVRTEEEGIAVLKEKLIKLREKRDNILSQRQLKLEGFSPLNAFSAYESVSDIIEYVFNNIQDNADRRFNLQRLLENEEKLVAVKNARDPILNELAHLHSKREHMEAHKESGNTVCPQCNHTWNTGYEESKYNALMKQIEKKAAIAKENEESIRVLTESIQEMQAYSALYKEYTKCVRNWPVLQPFWEYLNNSSLVLDYPRQVLAKWNILKEDLQLDIAAQQIESEIHDVNQLIQAAIQVGDTNLTEMRQKLAECSTDIEILTSDCSHLQREVNELNRFKRELNEANELAKQIQLLLDGAETANEQLIETMRRETISHCIRQLQSSLANKQEALSEITLQKKLVIELEREIETLTVEEEANALIVNALSPTDGLIAEGLLGFIRDFIGKMNGVIKKIWTYPLQVQICGTGDGSSTDLDYKFPLLIQSKSNIIPDVKFGSTGMCEIVDMGFIIVAMNALHLQEFPFIIDEFSANFDETHQNMAMNAIRSMMETSNFTQLFMVDHHFSAYGSFSNAEYCVLSENNITLPERYNEHVEIT